MECTNILTLMLDDDEMREMHNNALRKIDELNELKDGSDKACKSGHHHPSINEYGDSQCIRCYLMLSPTALKKELAINVFWSNNPEGRLERLNKMRTLVIKGKAKNNDRITVSGYRYVEGRGYVPVDRVFYDPD